MSAGMIAVFRSEGEILAAAQAAREKMHFKNFDALTPYPVHGLDAAMGLKRSWLPYVTFVAGLTGLASAVALEVWTSAFDWPLNVGGKPFISFPAFVPIMFELTVLFGGLCTVGALFYACKLPQSNPKILHEGITKDRFVLFVPSTETGYDTQKVREFLNSLHPEDVLEIQK